MPGRSANSTDRHVGSRVRTRRLELAMSQKALAERLGITFQQVQKYEKGTNRISASRLQGIAGALDVPIHFFFEDTARPRQHAPKGRQYASPRQVSAFLATPDGHALMAAFRRITDSKLRHSVLRALESRLKGSRS